jgi:hypothetical protein
MEKWKIRVNHYGTFDFDGTEEEAEATRINKARWEGGIGMKWRADLSTEVDRLAAEIAGLLDEGNGVPGELFSRWCALRKAGTP